MVLSAFGPALPTHPLIDVVDVVIWEVCACRAQRRRLLYPFLLLGDQVLSKQREGHLCYEMIKMKLSHSAHPCTFFWGSLSWNVFWLGMAWASSVLLSWSHNGISTIIISQSKCLGLPNHKYKNITGVLPLALHFYLGLPQLALVDTETLLQTHKR